MPPTPIAGPRRNRPTTLPPEPTVAVAADPVAARETLTSVQSPRKLVPLDYDEVRPAAPRHPVVTIAAPPRRRGGLRWFALGIAFGALGAVLATGEAGATLRSARSWSGHALRSIEHRPATTAPAPTHTMSVTTSRAPVATSEPCPMDPQPGDPCAELLAPFASEALHRGAIVASVVPTVPVEELPRVTPPAAPVVIPRAHAAARTMATPATTAAQERSEPPRGINPDGEDTQASPVKIVPPGTRPGPDVPGVDPARSPNAPT